MGIRNKITGEFYSIAAYDPSTGNVTGITNTGGNTDLGNVSTVFIGGGNVGEVLSTDGTGNLSWITASSGAPNSIVNGTTTVDIPVADGNIVAQVAGLNWTFNSVGTLVLPPTSTAAIEGTDGENVRIRAVSTGGPSSARLENYNGGATIAAVSVNPGTVDITVDSNTWLFGNDGNLALADGGFLVVSGGIVGGGASPAPYLSGFSSLSTAGAEGNITASGYFKGDGGYLSNIAGANVTGEVALANTVSNPAQPNITSVGVLASLTANSLTLEGQMTANGNVQFNQDVYFAGNVTLPGNINQISGNSGQFFGDPVTGFGGIYVGLPAGYTLLDNEVAQFSDNFNGYTQVTHRNINGGDQATGDFVITADNGTDLVNHIDLGMAGSGYNGALANNSLGTSLYPNDGYLYTRGNVTGGNLVIGSNQSGGVVRIIANGASNIGNVVATFGATGLTVDANVTAGNFIGDGSQLTNLPVTQDITSVGDMSIMTYDGNLKYVSNATIEPATGDIGSAGNISADGNISATGNVSGGNLTIIGGANFGQNGKAPAFLISGNGATEIRSSLGVGTDISLGGNLSLTGAGSVIQSGVILTENDGINSITLGTTTTMDVFGFPFTGGVTRGILTISDCSTTVEANGDWYYQSVGTNAFVLYTNNTYTTPVDSTAWTPYTVQDGVVDIQVQSPSNVDVVISSNGFLSRFNNAGLQLPANLTAVGNVTASYIIGDGSQLTNLPTPAPVIDFVASASSIAPPVGATQYNITALAESATISAPVGTPVDGQKMTIRILDNGTPQSLTWNSIYEVIGTTLPATTVASKYTYVGIIYNAQSDKWDVVSVAQQA